MFGKHEKEKVTQFDRWEIWYLHLYRFSLQMKLPFVVQRLRGYQYSSETQFKSLAGYIRGKFSFKSYGMSSPLGRVSLMKEEDAEQFKKQRNKLFLQDIHLFPFDLLYIFRMLTSYYVVNTSLQIIFCSAVFIAFLNKVFWVLSRPTYTNVFAVCFWYLKVCKDSLPDTGRQFYCSWSPAATWR